MSAPKQTDIEPTHSGLGPGGGLRAARESRGLSLDEMVDQLHLSRAMIEAIERDDYAVLPGSVFVRGYLKNYARTVGMSPEQVIATYERGRPEEQIVTPVVKGNIKEEVSSGHAGVRLVTWAIILLLIALVFIWWKGYLDWVPRVPASPGVSMLEPGPVTEAPFEPGFAPLPPLAGDAEAEAPATATGRDLILDTEPLAVSPEPVDVQLPSVEETASPQISAEQPEVVVEAPAPEPAGRVVLEFSGPCWVNVRDSLGQSRLFGEMRAGDKKVIEGTPPWSVVLGSSRAVRITVDGQVFDHSRYSSGNVARFKLSPSGL